MPSPARGRNYGRRHCCQAIAALGIMLYAASVSGTAGGGTGGILATCRAARHSESGRTEGSLLTAGEAFAGPPRRASRRKSTSAFKAARVWRRLG